MMIFKKQILLLFIFVFLIPFWAAGIEYQGLGGLPAYPNPNDRKTSSWFIYGLPPGGQKQDGIMILNNTAEDVTVLVYPQDSIKSSDGGFALKQFGDSRAEVGRWVRLYDDPPEVLATTTTDILQICDEEKQKPEKRQREEVQEWCAGKDSIEVVLPALSNKVIPFIISIPEQTDVGEHTGGILIQKKEPEKSRSQGGILISTRVGVRIYETVPGEIIKNLTLTSA